MKKVYLRFGNLPPLNQSMNYQTEQPEPGVSVYEALEYEDGSYRILHPTKYYEARGFSATLADLFMDRRVYVVEGDEADWVGSDGEPLLINPVVVKEVTEYFNPRLLTLPEPKVHEHLLEPEEWEEPISHYCPWRVEITLQQPVRTLRYLHVAAVRDTRTDSPLWRDHRGQLTFPVDLKTNYPSIPLVDGNEFEIIHSGFRTRFEIELDGDSVRLVSRSPEQRYEFLFHLRTASAKYSSKPVLMIPELPFAPGRIKNRLLKFFELSIREPALKIQNRENEHVLAFEEYTIHFRDMDWHLDKDFPKTTFTICKYAPAHLTLRVGRIKLDFKAVPTLAKKGYAFHYLSTLSGKAYLREILPSNSTSETDVCVDEDGANRDI